ncbi:MAG: nitroreductase family protein [Saprospiraceae bacterium]
MIEPTFIPYNTAHLEIGEVTERSHAFYETMDKRRTVREFSDKPVPKEVIEQIILTASSAPSGAHKQPWTFCAVADPSIKKQIRIAAEKEEYESYHGRMSDEWLMDLAPIGTDWNKPFLEIAPWLIIVFRKAYDLVDGEKRKCYYVNESVGIACGFLLAAIHQAGLTSLTHTPSPMNFLQKILNRPDNERPFLLVPVGFAAEDAKVPDLKRKPLSEVAVFYE